MSTLTLARQIARCLGDSWTACGGEGLYRAEANLHGPHDQLLSLYSGSGSHRKSDHGRLFITGDLGILGNHVPYRTNSYRITVAESKPPATIADDIRRRLLPGYQAAQKAAREAKQRSDGINAAREQLATTVAASLGADRPGRDSTVSFGQFDVGVYGTVQVHRGDYHSEFTVYVPRDRVAAFAHLLNSFCRHTEPPPRRSTPSHNDLHRAHDPR